MAVGVLVVGGGIGAAVALSGGDDGAGPGPTTPPPTSPEVPVTDGSTVPPSRTSRSPTATTLSSTA